MPKQILINKPFPKGTEPNFKTDCIITSPPYNIGIDYDEHDDKLGNKEYTDLINQLFSWSFCELKEEGSLFVNFGVTPSQQEHFAFVLPRIAKRYEFQLQNTIIWVKSIAISNSVSFGNFRPLNSESYLSNMWEFVFHFTKNKIPMCKDNISVWQKDKSNVARFGKSTRDRGNVWFIPSENRNEELEHPASFPVALPGMCIDYHFGNHPGNGHVKDPFAGSGTVGIAAFDRGHNFTGYEISEKYFKLAQERLDKHTGADIKGRLF